VKKSYSKEREVRISKEKHINEESFKRFENRKKSEARNEEIRLNNAKKTKKTIHKGWPF
jgi:hypothetical protein